METTDHVLIVDDGRGAGMIPASWLHWPRTLFARLAVILFVGLALAQTLSFWLTMTERDQTMTNVTMGYIEREVASSVSLLPLAITRQLALAMDATLSLHNRLSGGLEARLTLKNPG